MIGPRSARSSQMRPPTSGRAKSRAMPSAQSCSPGSRRNARLTASPQRHHRRTCGRAAATGRHTGRSESASIPRCQSCRWRAAYQPALGAGSGCLRDAPGMADGTPVARRALVLVTGAVVALAVACSPGGNGFTTTNIVTAIDGSRVCLGRLDGRSDAKDVACFETSDVPGASDVQLGDCVRAERFDESGRVKRLRLVEPARCDAS